MLTTKRTTETKLIHNTLKITVVSVLKPKKGSTFETIIPLNRLATCVRGRTPMPTACKGVGRMENGKKVPLRRNIGVMNKNAGKLKKSMFLAMAVKHIPIEANKSPEKKDNIGTKNTKGLETRPKAATTTKTIVAFIVARVAPQTISPAITSSTLTGVAIMASNVFWKYMRTKEA